MRGGTCQISIEGRDVELVNALKRIFSDNKNDLMKGSDLSAAGRSGITVVTGIGVVGGPEPAASITVGVNLIKE